MRYRSSLFVIVTVFLVFVAIPVGAQSSPLQVLASTTIIADVAQHVGGELVELTALVPPNIDVHAFEPRPADVVAITRADLVLVNGAGLEGFLDDLIANAGDVEAIEVSIGVPVLPFGGHDHEDGDHDEGDHDDGDHDDGDHDDGDHDDGHDEHLGLLGVDILCDGESHDEGDDHAHGDCDPHFWTDPHNVMIWADNIATALSAVDPDNGSIYRANAEAYKTELEALDAEIESLLSTIPEGGRIMVTNHEFLRYFAHRYDFEIVGVVIGSTTVEEPQPQALAGLVSVINETGIPAIFAEVSDTQPLAAVIADEIDHEVAIVRLYSGSLSEPDGPAGTYIDYMRYNTQAIAGALGG